MAELESSLEEYFRHRARLLGGYTIKLAPTERGIPDRLLMMPGSRMFLVELKADNGSLSPIQRHWHAKVLEHQGIRVHVLTGRDDVNSFLTAVVRLSDMEKRPRPRPRSA